MPLGTVVSTNPANFTPNVVSGAVYKFIQLNGVLYAGGSFSSVSTATGVSPGGTFTRHNLVAFNPTTGVITAFSPDIDGAVWALATDGTSLYVGGTFSSVNGVARRGLAKLDPVTGAVDTAFNARLTNTVKDATMVNGRLIVSGSSPRGWPPLTQEPAPTAATSTSGSAARSPPTPGRSRSTGSQSTRPGPGWSGSGTSPPSTVSRAGGPSWRPSAPRQRR
jgi:hypothetical protein